MEKSQEKINSSNGISSYLKKIFNSCVSKIVVGSAITIITLVALVALTATGRVNQQTPLAWTCLIFAPGLSTLYTIIKGVEADFISKGRWIEPGYYQIPGHPDSDGGLHVQEGEICGTAIFSPTIFEEGYVWDLLEPKEIILSLPEKVPVRMTTLCITYDSTWWPWWVEKERKLYAVKFDPPLLL